MKYLKNEMPDGSVNGQSEISDELAELWIKNGNKNISDSPWPDLKMVKALFVSDKPLEKA